jgi:hypothetical protein
MGEVAMSNNRENYWEDEEEDEDVQADFGIADTDLVKKTA